MEKFHMGLGKGMEFGLYTLGDHIENSETGYKISEKQRMKEMVDLAKLSEDAVVFGSWFTIWGL